jgi:hypothetical protein
MAEHATMHTERTLRRLIAARYRGASGEISLDFHGNRERPPRRRAALSVDFARLCAPSLAVQRRATRRPMSDPIDDTRRSWNAATRNHNAHKGDQHSIACKNSDERSVRGGGTIARRQPRLEDGGEARRHRVADSGCVLDRPPFDGSGKSAAPRRKERAE